jgi:hypothetical protein
MVLAILSCWDLDVQQGLFKLTMKSNIVQAMVEVVALHLIRLMLPSSIFSHTCGK